MYAGKVLQFAAARLLVEPFCVARLGQIQGCIDEYLDELARLDQAASHAPFRAKRRYEGHHDDEPGIDHQACHLGDTSNVLDSILVGEAQVLVEPMTHIV